MTEENLIKQNYLRRYQWACQEIDAWQDELEIWIARATRITTTFSDMPKGGERQTMDDAIVKYLEIADNLNAKIVEAVQIKIEVEACIDAIEDGRLRAVLRLRYINLKKWEVICYKNNYSWQHIHRLHIFALEAININHVIVSD